MIVSNETKGEKSFVGCWFFGLESEDALNMIFIFTQC